MALTDAELEEDKIFYETYNTLVDFFINKTNCTTLQHPELEADDLIAGWIQGHSDDEHTIVSSDSDYYQLIAKNVTQYNGITDETITLAGFLDKKNRPIIDKKTKLPKLLGDPQFVLFEKIIRGDTSDNVFSAYPGVRLKGTKNKVGIEEAFADRNNKGFNYNNFMLQKWPDHNGVDHKVLDDYARNVTLIDLTAQPANIKQKIVDTVTASQVHKQKQMVGAQFLKFCGKHRLNKLSEQTQTYGEILNSGYPE